MYSDSIRIDHDGMASELLLYKVGVWVRMCYVMVTKHIQWNLR